MTSHLHPQGYSRDMSFLETVVDIIQELKKTNPSLVYGESTVSTLQIGIISIGRFIYPLVSAQKISNNFENHLCHKIKIKNDSQVLLFQV